MTGTTWGIPSTGISEPQWRRMMTLMWGDGVVPGVLSEYEVYANSTGMRVFVRSGVGVIQGAWHEETADVELPITSNGSGLARIDLVVGRFNDTTDIWELAVVTGTPNASPTPPSASTINPYEIPLAYVAVANGAATIAAGDVTDRRTYGYANLGGIPRTIVRNTASQSISTGTGSFTNLTFNQVIEDTLRSYSTGAPTQLTLPVDGLYDVECRYAWNNTAAGRRYGQLTLNGTALHEVEAAANPVRPHHQRLAARFQASAASVLRAGVMQDTGSSLTVVPTADASIIMTVTRVG